MRKNEKFQVLKETCIPPCDCNTEALLEVVLLSVSVFVSTGLDLRKILGLLGKDRNILSCKPDCLSCIGQPTQAQVGPQSQSSPLSIAQPFCIPIELIFWFFVLLVDVSPSFFTLLVPQQSFFLVIGSDRLVLLICEE